jgi:hypothetical protein
MENELATEDSSENDGLSWRDLAVARSLDSARLRAESRVQRFLDAAIELLNSGSGGLHGPGGGRALRPVPTQLLPVLRRKARAAPGPVRGVRSLDHRAPPIRRSPGGRSARAPAPLRGGVLPAVPAHGGGRDDDTDRAGRSSWPSSPSSFSRRIRRRRPGCSLPSWRYSTRSSKRRPPQAVVRPMTSAGPIVGVVLEVIMFNTFSATIGGSSVRSR